MSTSCRERLTAYLPNLPDADKRFAHSLLASRAPSTKQLLWMDKLVDRCMAAQSPPEEEVQIDNVLGIVSLLNRGHSALKRPKIAFTTVDGTDLRLSIAGDAARHPGTINVTDSRGGNWYGRIHLDGRWEPGRSCTRAQSALIVSALHAFAANPAKVAAEYGRLTGNCCFCCRDLTDDRSTAVGYGKVCASHYGLPWGE